MPHGPSFLPPDLFNRTSLKTVQGVHADLLKVVARAQEISDVDFEIVPGTGGMRSAKMQAALKAKGASRAKLGRHTFGHAIDLVPVDARGKADWGDLDGFDKIRDAMKQAATELGVPIMWGGNWKKLVDRPHFELDRAVYPGPNESRKPETLMVAFR
jgi:peptidoglycan L-alanyl-D-glutamate endopeptidase CwlK